MRINFIPKVIRLLNLRTFEWYRDSVKQFGEGSTAKFDALADLFGKPDITALSREFNQVLRGI